MADVITPNFGSPTGGGTPPPPPEMSLSEALFQLSKAQDTIDHLTMVLVSKSAECDKLTEFVCAYDKHLTELLNGHVQQAQNAKKTAEQLEAIRSSLLTGK